MPVGCVHSRSNNVACGLHRSRVSVRVATERQVLWVHRKAERDLLRLTRHDPVLKPRFCSLAVIAPVKAAMTTIPASVVPP